MANAGDTNINTDDFIVVKSRKQKRKENTAKEVELHKTKDKTIQKSVLNLRKIKRMKTGEKLDERLEYRKIQIPAHRYAPLQENWKDIVVTLSEHLKLNVRKDHETKCVELKTSPNTPDIGNLQKGADFIKAFMYGFEVDDARALVRVDGLFIDTFEIKDVKTLQGDHLSRTIGRIAGKGGQTKFTIENSTKTRIVLADSKIHILGSFQSIQVARRTICNLIIGAAPSKVYGKLRSAANSIAGI